MYFRDLVKLVRLSQIYYEPYFVQPNRDPSHRLPYMVIGLGFLYNLIMDFVNDQSMAHE